MPKKTDTVLYQKQGEVIKNNSFIRCSNNLTTIQRKSFALFLKETIDTINDTGEQRFYSMPLTRYRSMMGHPDSMPTKYIAKELEELMTKLVKWDIDAQGYGARSVMLASFTLEKQKGILEWEFSYKLLYKLIADGYTPLKLSVILDFNSKYSLALYENLQMRKNFNKTEFNLNEFRALMGVEDNEHQRMESFKRKVLNVAIDEINAKSDMLVTCDDIKEGAKIVGFRFAWKIISEDDIKKRNKKRELIEHYQKELSPSMGMKFKISGKWYTLTKQGFIYRGKILGGFDIVDSYEQYKKLDSAGLVTEKKGYSQPTLC